MEKKLLIVHASSEFEMARKLMGHVRYLFQNAYELVSIPALQMLSPVRSNEVRVAILVMTKDFLLEVEEHATAKICLHNLQAEAEVIYAYFKPVIESNAVPWVTRVFPYPRDAKAIMGGGYKEDELLLALSKLAEQLADRKEKQLTPEITISNTTLPAFTVNGHRIKEATYQYQVFQRLLQEVPSEQQFDAFIKDNYENFYGSHGYQLARGLEEKIRTLIAYLTLMSYWKGFCIKMSWDYDERAADYYSK